MIVDPIQHFLGVPGTTDALRLLGLAPGRLDAAMIETALELQLARVYQHPDGGDPDADRVRQRLRSAAAQLRQSVSTGRLGNVFTPPPAQVVGAPRPPATSRFRLTPFDRQVLAVLVGLGGWNARSRARLVALAGTYGVSVQGLLRVLKGLAEYARGGGPRLGVQDITGGQVMTPPSSDASMDEMPVTPALLDRLATRLADELRREGRWPTIKLSLIFGSVTMAVGTLVMWWLVSTSSPPPPAASPVTAPIAAAPKEGTTPATRPSSQAKNTAARVLAFRRLPTFLGNGLPVQAAAAADQINEHLAALDDVIRRLSITTEPSDAVYRSWDEAVKAVSTGWPLIDASARQGAAQKIEEALSVAVTTPPVLDRLLRTLVPPAPDNVIEPVDVWRGSWLAGTLGRAAASSTLPPIVIEQSRHLLHAAFGPATAENTGGFNEFASLWLDRALPSMVRSIHDDDRTYDQWELWIGAQRLLGGGQRHQTAIMRALESLLESPTDLSVPGPAQNVLGRLVALALDDPGIVVRERMLSFYDDTSISVNDLWVLTSLLAAGPAAKWVTPQLVVPPDADDLHRSRLREALARAWPEPSSSAEDQAGQALAIAVDQELGQRWLVALQATLAQKPAGSPEALVSQIIMISRLIEAIDELVAKNNVRADELLADIEQTLAGAGEEDAPTAGKSTAQQRPGQPLGMDGQWTAEYGDLGRSNEDRLQSLRALRTNAGTDLGPIDAATLVHEAYRGATMDVRTLALGIIADQFGSGPIVAMELLDQFPDARPTGVLSDMIQRLSGRSLPAIRTAEWSTEARLALVEHVLNLRPGSRREIDLLTHALTDSYARRLSALQSDASSNTVTDSPAQAAELLMQAWLDRAGVTLASNPVPADLGGIQQRLAIRLKLAEGPIQQFVAHQLAILDLLAYVTVAEQPSLREPVVALLRDSTLRRTAVHGVLEQSLEAERAVAALWRLRIGLERRSRLPGVEATESES